MELIYWDDLNDFEKMYMAATMFYPGISFVEFTIRMLYDPIWVANFINKMERHLEREKNERKTIKSNGQGPASIT